MTAIEIFQVGDVEYVTLKVAAKYLGLALRTVESYVYLGKFDTVRNQSGRRLEWKSVKAFAAKRGQKRNGKGLT